MAIKRKSTKVSVGSQRASGRAEGFLSQIKWGESYTSLFLGAIVVIVVLVLAVSYFRSRNTTQSISQPISTVSKEQNYSGTNIPKTYAVSEGDNLWQIAQKIYGSGYNWVDLANANKLQNPGLLYVGTKLFVPNIKPRLLTTQVNQVQQPNPITGVSYTVVKGDYLWSIAERAYGDGYKWVVIAKANNLINPNIIHPGNILKLPR